MTDIPALKCLRSPSANSEFQYNNIIIKEVTEYVLETLDIDSCCLDANDRTLILTIIDKFSDGPVGIDTLSVVIGEDSGTVEDVYEPYLLMMGFIKRTPSGCVATDKAYSHLNRHDNLPGEKNK